MRLLPAVTLWALVAAYASAVAGAIVVALVSWRRARREMRRAARPQPLPAAKVVRRG